MSFVLVPLHGLHVDRVYRQEDLGLYGNQLNYMQTCWTVGECQHQMDSACLLLTQLGYVIGEIPSNIVLTRVRPRYWLPALEVTTALHYPLPKSRQLTIKTVSLDHPHLLHLQSQQCNSTICHPFLCWHVT